MNTQTCIKHQFDTLVIINILVTAFAWSPDCRNFCYWIWATLWPK